jgi:Zn ribbon nucleic-acid-binding protein
MGSPHQLSVNLRPSQLHVSCHACDVIAADAAQSEYGAAARFCEVVAILASWHAQGVPHHRAVACAAAHRTAQNLLRIRNNVVVE